MKYVPILSSCQPSIDDSIWRVGCAVARWCSWWPWSFLLCSLHRLHNVSAHIYHVFRLNLTIYMSDYIHICIWWIWIFVIFTITACPQQFEVDNGNATTVESATLEGEIKDDRKLVFCTRRSRKVVGRGLIVVYCCEPEWPNETCYATRQECRAKCLALDPEIRA